MQRRKVEVPRGNAAAGSSPTHNNYKDKPRGGACFHVGKHTKKIVFLVVAGLSFFTFMHPSEMHDAENKAVQMEHQMEDWLLHKNLRNGEPEEEEQQQTQQPPPPLKQNESSELLGGYSWVEGEKKLKEKLKILDARQAKGLDLGVKVLTRWMGDDIPAWVSEDMNEKEWQDKVNAKYKEMAKEEEKWKANMRKHIERNPLRSRPGL